MSAVFSQIQSARAIVIEALLCANPNVMMSRIRTIAELMLAGNTRTSVVLRTIGVQDGRPYDANYAFPNRFTLVRAPQGRRMLVVIFSCCCFAPDRWLRSWHTASM